MTKTDAPASALPVPRPQPRRAARLFDVLEAHAIAIAATAMVAISVIRLLVVRA